MARNGRRDIEFGDPAVFDRQLKPHSKDVFLQKISFYAATNVSTIIGWIVLCATAYALRGWTPDVKWHYFVVVGVVLVSMIAGSIIAVKSESWKVSTFAYLGLIAAPLGVLFGPFVLAVGVENMIYAVVATAAWTVVLTLFGLGVKTDLEHMGFGGALTGVLAIYLLVSLVLFKLTAVNATAMIIMAVIGIAIFSLGLVYNVNRSKFVPKTLDNAVDIGMQNFLETVNIALRLAQILRHVRS